jgi:hypothetical protein
LPPDWVRSVRLIKSHPNHADGETGIDLYTNYVTQQATASVHRDIKQTTPLGYLNYEDIDQFISQLKMWHREEIASKEDRFLLSPAIFNLGGKKTEHIEFMRHLWLDFEKGHLKPEQFADMFPGVQLVVMSTFNHREKAPRFRVFMPTIKAITPEAYIYLWNQIAAKLKSRGYSVKANSKRENKVVGTPSGMDITTRSPHTIFYAPCRAKGSTDAFFTDYPGEVLDPVTWIENGVAVPDSPRPIFKPREREKVSRPVDQASRLSNPGVSEPWTGRRK